jgi:hypothetical protein
MAKRRNAAALLAPATPSSRCKTAFRVAASTCGAAPVRTRQLSSPKVTSRTPCKRFSIAQWPRTSARSRPASASPGGKLVIP